MNLANNHSLDKGTGGVTTTKSTLTAVKLLHSAENGELTVVKVKNATSDAGADVAAQQQPGRRGVGTTAGAGAQPVCQRAGPGR